MKIEIISTGEELLTGSVTDTNAAFIAQKFEENNYNVIRHTTTGDDYRTLVELFKEAGKRSDIIVVSGGLGPTTDDRSAEAAANAAGSYLKQNDDAIESVKKYFDKHGRSMSESDLKQTMLPECADCLENPIGTAPGFSLMVDASLFYFIPGVPLEMKEMLVNTVLPGVDSLSGRQSSQTLKKSLFLFGLPEAVVDEKLKGIEKKFAGIITGFRADFPVIEIKLSMKVDKKTSRKKDEALFLRAVEWVHEQIGDYIFSDSTGKIEAVVGKLLSDKKKTLAVAESCTGGLIGHRLTAVAGSSDYFITSCVTYANKAKADILGVKPETIETYGAVSEETVKEMADGVRRISGADYAIATSGVAGPDGGSPEKPVGIVFISISSDVETKVFEFRSPFQGREQNKIIFYMKSLDLLRKQLLS